MCKKKRLFSRRADVTITILKGEVVFRTLLKLSGKAVALIIDGSFTTGKPEPSDIDLIVVLSAEFDPSIMLKPFDYNVLTKRGARRTWRFDVFSIPQTSDALAVQIDFFKNIREPSDRKKGMLRIEL